MPLPVQRGEAVWIISVDARVGERAAALTDLERGTSRPRPAMLRK